jgi:hypothetical protein
MKKENSGIQILGFAFVGAVALVQLLVPREGGGGFIALREIIGKVVAHPCLPTSFP